MKTLKSSALFFGLLLLPACGKQLVEFGNLGTTDSGAPDGRAIDVGKMDVANTDAAKTDAANTDVGKSDVANTDAANADARNTDAANTDAANADARNTDARNTDGANTDAANTDARNTDGANTDVATTDGANLDLPKIDVTNPDVANLDLANLDVGNIDTASACGQAPVALGAAGNFVVLAGSTVTNTGPTSVTGDLGVSPGTAVTGFPPGTVVGAQHAGDPTAAQGEAALTTAYNDAAGRTLCPVSVAGNLGGQTLAPGLYKSTSSLEISSGDLTLDGKGDGNAVFIFQMASTLTTTSGRQVILIGGARSTNVFWQVGSSATLGSTTAFQGTIMADQAITLNTGATLNGRALARIAAVTLDSNTVVKPAP